MNYLERTWYVIRSIFLGMFSILWYSFAFVFIPVAIINQFVYHELFDEHFNVIFVAFVICSIVILFLLIKKHYELINLSEDCE